LILKNKYLKNIIYIYFYIKNIIYIYFYIKNIFLKKTVIIILNTLKKKKNFNHRKHDNAAFVSLRVHGLPDQYTTPLQIKIKNISLLKSLRRYSLNEFEFNQSTLFYQITSYLFLCFKSIFKKY